MLPPEIFEACFGSLTLTTSAQIIPQGDHACYELQRSLARVNKIFRDRIGEFTGQEQLVKVHYAADDDLSPTKFIPVVSTRASKLEDLSPEEKGRIFFAYVSICDGRRDGRTASQDTTCTNVVVTLDTLSFWLAVVASRQYTRRSAGLFALTIDVKIWDESEKKLDWRSNLYHALSLLHRESAQLSVSLAGKKLDSQEIWRRQHSLTPFHAVLLRKSWLDHALRHGRILAFFRNDFALQIMCGDLMQHFNNMRSKGGIGLASLRRGLVAILCSLLLTWFAHYQRQTSQGNYLDDTEEQRRIKAEEAGCDADSCPCVLLYMLELPGAQTLVASPTELLRCGIDGLAGRKLCWISLLVHHIYWHHDEAGHVSHRRACLDSLKKLQDMYGILEDDQSLAQDIEVIAVAAEHGIEGFEGRPDLNVAVDEDDGDDDSAESNQVWNRLSVAKSAAERTMWEVCEGKIQCIRVQSDVQEDVFAKDIFEFSLLRRIRGSMGSMTHVVDI